MSQDKQAPASADDNAQFTRNVVLAWVGFAAQSAAGFVMPRLISDSLGQVSLGTWDLAWSLVSYLGLIQLGLVASVNKYVAAYRAQHDTAALQRSVSSIAMFLLAAGVVAAGAACAIAFYAVPLFNQLGADTPSTQWVVFVLGLDMAASFMFAVNTGIIVGCLRSDLHYTVSSFTYTAAVIGMVAAVLGGGGLGAIASVQLIVTLTGELIRWRLARRICPEVRIVPADASWAVLRDQARFTSKATVPFVAETLLNHSLSILVTAYIGPAALAVFSRPRNLVRQVRTLTARFGYILVPTASALQAKAAGSELATAALDRSVQIALLMMPVAVSLLVLGDDLIRLWMGDGYATYGLLSVLVIGSLPSWIQDPLWSMLTGTNQHGRIAIIKAITSCLTAVLLFVGLAWLGWSLLGVTVSLVVPAAIVDGFVVPWIACRTFNIRLAAFYRAVWLRPLAYACPYGVSLLLLRETLGGRPQAVVVEVAVGLGILWLTYRQRSATATWAYLRG